MGNMAKIVKVQTARGRYFITIPKRFIEAIGADYMTVTIEGSRVIYTPIKSGR